MRLTCFSRCLCVTGAGALLFFASLFLFAVLSGPTFAGNAQDSDAAGGFDSRRALEISQASIGNQLGDFTFVSGSGEPVSMASLRGKPLVLSLVYTSCYHICPMTTRHLSKVVEKAREALGTDSFNVATLGFDADHDTPDTLRQFAKNQAVDGRDWLLLSADKDTVGQLVEHLGFTYISSPRGFDHVIQATVIDGEGRIYRQVYGEVFETPLLVEPLKELVLGRPKPGQPFLADLMDRIRFFCTTYDPSRDAYHFDLSIFIGMSIGGMILILSFLFVARELMRRRRSTET